MEDRTWDAVVVGSGISGGWAAKELTERGLRVLVVERGRNVVHAKDYTTEHVPPWELPYRGRGNPRTLEADYPIQRKAPQLNESNWHFFVKDSEHPYVQEEGTDWAWVRGYQLGGRSLTWGRQVYRLSDLDFEANLKDGHGVDWPIRYSDIAPWYDHVEDFIGVSGQEEGLPQLPDGRFLPPMEMNCLERDVKSDIESAFPDRRMTIGRVAILTRSREGRGACHYCGPCERGCSVGAYFSSQSSTLPAAHATGRLEVVTDSIVERVLYDPTRKRATGIAIIDSKTRERREIRSRLVFLCASTIPTTQILLNSASEDAPNGLANSSGTLGRYLMDHTIGMAAMGIFTGRENEGVRGNRPNGIYIPRFRNVHDATPGFVRGYGYQGMAMKMGWSSGLAFPGFGSQFKAGMSKPGGWLFFLSGFGECLPSAENRVLLADRRDDWGMPQAKVRFQWGDNENAMRTDITEQGVAMLQSAGAAQVVPGSAMGVGGEAIHEMGTARMGRDASSSVLNAHNQSHDVPNLFVTDGSAMTSSACQNPSLTYMALTARACAYAAGELERGLA